MQHGTGNGQVAVKVPASFKSVHAADLSAAQLQHAPHRENIFYHTTRAEEDFFPESQFELITAAQAIHWFDMNRFYAQVTKTSRPAGVLADIWYDILQINKEINSLIDEFYRKTTGPYWDPERKLIDDHYAIIPFPFKEIQTPGFWMHYKWNFQQLIGYFNTCSAVQHYIRKNNENPVNALAPLRQA